MNRRTFYVAAASSRAAEARLKMLEVETLGYVQRQDWTQALAAHVSEYPKLAEDDVAAARESDLFVLLAQPMSYGAFLELGARLGAGKRAHVVNPGASERHFFTFHRLVILHPTWESFIQAAAREAKAP